MILNDPLAHLQKTYWHFEQEDLPGTMAGFKRDAVHHMHIPEDLLPYGGPAVGIDKIAERLGLILQVFQVIAFAPVSMEQRDDIITVQINYHYVHRKSGRVLQSDTRHHVIMDGDLIARIDEWPDPDILRTFIRLIEAEVAPPDPDA
ncbi:MAG: hypothetical protein AAFR04_15800 [Pseudomonadota bacterium]